MNRKIINVILFALLIIGVYNGLIYIKERVKERQRVEERKKELVELQKKEIEERKQEEQQKKRSLELDRKEREERVKAFQRAQKEATRPTPPPTPPPTSPPRTTVNHLYNVKTICDKHLCILLSYNEQGHAIYIEVAGPDHNSISDILNDLIKAGAINFTEHREKYGIRMINNKRMYCAAYTLRW